MDPVGYRLLSRTLARGKPVRLELQGRCMHPLLQDGDTARIEPAGRVGIGDVVLARTRRDDVVCHRVLGVGSAGLLLAGDRSLSPERHPPGSVLGRVTAVERRGGAAFLGLDRRRWIGRLGARWQLSSWRLRRRPTGRLLEAARRRVWLPAAARAVLAARRGLR